MEKILIVDDSELNREILSSIFEGQFEILEAEDGVIACDVIDKYKAAIKLIFLDLVMPRKSGLAVLAHIRQSGLMDKIPVVMITGESTEDSDNQASEYGADDIIYKPFSVNVVRRRGMNLMEQYRHRNEMEIELAKRTREVIEGKEQLTRVNEMLLDALGSVVEFRSLESGEHIKRVKLFTFVILECVRTCYPEYGLTSEKTRTMAQAAALHDVGKIAISDEILAAPRRLTYEEYEEMKKHTTYGCEILDRFRVVEGDFFKYSYEICRWHHEKVDGNGYPDGLKGDQIPIYCQAASVADCFDALISKRVYKDAYGFEAACDMIKRGECGAFSEVILHCFEVAKDDLINVVKHVM